MIARVPLRRRLDPARRFLRDEAGAGLVEYALVILLFLTLLFGIIDFGRLGFAVVSANKANQIAARIAAVRPPACDDPWPRTIGRGSDASATFGTLCRAGTGICADPGEITCTYSPDDELSATAEEVFDTVRSLLPPRPRNPEENIRLNFSYRFDPNLGFLGGPYIPMVTVELDDVQFDFVVPLGRLTDGIRLPRMSVSLPGEDLCHGEGAGCN